MPIDIPTTRKEVVDRSKTDVQNELGGSNPFLQDSAIGATIVAFSGRIFDFYLSLRKAIDLLFVQTSSGTQLELLGAYVKVFRLPATQSSGLLSITGTVGTLIPALKEFQASNTFVYTTRTNATIANNVYSLSSLTRISQTATATTTNPHNLATGMTVTISGAVETQYNGSFEIQVTSDTTFTYTVVGAPTTPATGTILSSAAFASVIVDSTGFGSDKNLNSGEQLTQVSQQVGVNDPSFVQFNGVVGGQDIESDDSLRARILFAWQNPTPCFNEADIEVKAKEVSGVTRVFVKPITPAEGSVTTYFMRDNDTVTPIPPPTEVAKVKAKLLEIKTAHVNPDNVIVSAPSPVSVNFVFTSVTPNTQTMKEAVKNNLRQFFKEGTSVGVNIQAVAYNSAIYSTIDPETGERLQAFVLSAPVGNISISAGQIGVLGAVTI
jgi:uncharacterized phage protein gp47/JayE